MKRLLSMLLLVVALLLGANQASALVIGGPGFYVDVPPHVYVGPHYPAYWPPYYGPPYYGPPYYGPAYYGHPYYGPPYYGPPYPGPGFVVRVPGYHRHSYHHRRR